MQNIKSKLLRAGLTRYTFDHILYKKLCLGVPIIPKNVTLLTSMGANFKGSPQIGKDILENFERAMKQRKSGQVLKARTIRKITWLE